MKEKIWVELCKDWMDIKQINGEYKKSKKFGKCDIIENGNLFIGSGSYKLKWYEGWQMD
ncbi:unnamed protein product [Paramecium octaurelia]|nr:unnamed protein product [Paramecium octaurelia]